jgi:hypothetical protein
MTWRQVLPWWVIAVMFVGGVVVMLGTAFADWDSAQQYVASWAWIMTVAWFRATWLLAGRS